MSTVPEWKSVASEVVGDYGAFRVTRHTRESPRTGGTHEFHVVDVPMCVHVIPFTTDGSVILVEQFRPGVQRVSLEFPAGVMEDSEEPVAAALRAIPAAPPPRFVVREGRLALRADELTFAHILELRPVDADFAADVGGVPAFDFAPDDQ